MASGAMLKNQRFFFSSKLTYNYGKWSCLIGKSSNYMDDLLTYVGLLRGDHLKKTHQKTCVFFQEIFSRLGP
jgi:hypothetical protein